MRTFAVAICLFITACTYSPKYVVDSYNTYAPNYSRTTTVKESNEWEKDLKAIEAEFKRSLNQPKKTKKTTRYIYGVKK